MRYFLYFLEEHFYYVYICTQFHIISILYISLLRENFARPSENNRIRKQQHSVSLAVKAKHVQFHHSHHFRQEAFIVTLHSSDG